MVKEPKTSKGTDNLSVGNIEMAATLSLAIPEGAAYRKTITRSSAFNWSAGMSEDRRDKVLFHARSLMTGLKGGWNLAHI